MSGVSDSHPIVMSGRWIPEKGDSGQVFASFKYWATADLGLGVDYRPLIDNVSITATYRAVSEDPLGWRPAVILGTSEDDFSYKGSDVESRSYFFTLSKAMPDMKFWGVTPSPYAGAVWIEEIDKIRPLVGVHLRHQEASLTVQYSGTDTHLSLSRSLNDNLSLSAIYWGMKYPGFGMRIKF